MADYVIPSIGSQGYYQIATPFDRYIIPAMRYTCQAVRTLKHYIAEGQDPYTLFYSVNGLTQADYDQDYLENMSIVGLQAETGPILYVPARYITGYPLTDGVAYQEMMLGVSLGSLPSTLDLAALSTRIQNIVQESLGVKPIITPVQISAAVIVSTETDQRLTVARTALASQQLSDASRVTMLQRIVDSQRQTIAALEAFIVQHYVNHNDVDTAHAYYMLGQKTRRLHGGSNDTVSYEDPSMLYISDLTPYRVSDDPDIMYAIPLG